MRSRYRKRVGKKILPKGDTPVIPWKQPVKGSSIAWSDAYRDMKCFERAKVGVTYDAQLYEIRLMRERWMLWIDSYTTVYGTRYAYTRLKSDWKVLRVCISLQTRLVVEQIFFDRGDPYSRLVTGFGAIK